MSLFRANDRHPVDERILIIQNMEDFALWRRHRELEFEGIIWDMGLDRGYIDRLAEQIKAVYCDNDYFRKHRRPLANRSFMTYGNGEYRKEHVGKTMEDELGSEVATLAFRLGRAFALAQKPEEALDTIDLETRVGVNHTHPYNFHIHEPTLSFAFKSAGTTCCTGDITNPGEVYKIPLGHAGFIGPAIWHKVDEWDLEEETRFNLLVNRHIDRRIISL